MEEIHYLSLEIYDAPAASSLSLTSYFDVALEVPQESASLESTSALCCLADEPLLLAAAVASSSTKGEGGGNVGDDAGGCVDPAGRRGADDDEGEGSVS